MSDYIPPDIIRHILTKLPIRTLLRCTVVCKSWYFLITSPSFISSHLKLTLSNNENRLFVRICVSNRINAVESEHYYVHRDNQSFDEIQKFECPFNTENSHFSIVGSFNGLYCFFDDRLPYRERLILWNPSLRKSLTLPDPRVLYKSCGPYAHVVGFGFLPETNEYKVVRAVHLGGPDGWKTPPEVEIYDLSTGRWSDVDARDCSYVILERNSQAFLNNSVHWVANKRSKDTFHRAIVSINLKTEKFGTLMIPDNCQSNWGYSLSTFKDSLCLIHYGADQDSFWTIWVMNEYGVESSWVKQFSIYSGEIHDSFFYFRSIYFREKGDIILVGDSKFVSYDPKSKKVKNLGKWNLGKREEARSLYVDTYMESLVLIKVANNALSRDVAELDSQTGEGSRIKEKFSQM